MTDKNKLRDTILDMEASLSTNLNGYSMWHYGADIHGITRETLENAIEALKTQEPIKPNLEFNLAGQPMWCCGNCGTTLFFKFPRQIDDEDERSHYRFCYYCGRPVKWND